MINVSYDAERNVVIVEFGGTIDGAQAQKGFRNIDAVLPKHGKGFKVLADYSCVEAMDIDVEAEIKKAMAYFSARGVTEVVRIFPDPAMDFGFDTLSRRYYSKDVKLVTVRTRAEAEARLRNEAHT
jgi:hypothetical protein